jgi:Putative 2OG-Fe(II) oxygenase
MKIENVFGHNIVRINCPNIELYKNQELTESLDAVFNLPEIKNIDYARGSQDGYGLTFSDHPYLSLVNLPGAQNLAIWIKDSFISAKELLDLDNSGNDIKFVKSWSNRIFQGCGGRIHNHKGFRPVDVVGILYVDVPSTGAELVFVNNGESGKTHLDYDSSDLYYLQPTPGELIIHNSSIYHTITRHTEDMVRTVFVFDAIYN